ncbi:MAG: helix-turn-helix domain-containing protein [Ruminococcus sp.]|nr:helix-turn-helix domain-containing protein [Ruminococcus sp.]
MRINYKEVGRRVALRRKALSLKQYQLCEMINVNYKYVSNIETGRSAPSLEMIMSLCEALDTTPDYLLLGTDGVVSDRELLARINRLSPKSRTVAAGIIALLDEYE